jgi:hypothetical protein
MVRIKFTVRPKIHVVSSKPESMALDEVPKISAQQLDASMQQVEKSQSDQQKGALTETSSLCSADSDRESRSGDSGDSETASDNFGCLIVSVVAALAGISYDFGPSKVTKTRIGSIGSYARYFPKVYGRPLARSLCQSLKRMKLPSFDTKRIRNFHIMIYFLKEQPVFNLGH